MADTGDAAGMLARAAARSRFASLPEPIRASYRNFMLDALAVMAAGARHPSIASAREALLRVAGAGASTAVGFADGAPPATAALVNGMAMTPLQLQDGHRRARGHPMSHVLPAALAAAEQTGADCASFLDAVVAGYEVCARVGASLGGMQPLLHDTGTFGAIGAAVAAAHLLSDHDDRTGTIEAAIGIAAAVALFPFRDTCMEGASAHHLFVGLGAQTGVQSAVAAAAGLRPSLATLERFFGPRAGENFDARMLCAGIADDGGWSRYEIAEAYLKWHPVCAHLGPMLDCLAALRARLADIPWHAIRDVEVCVYSTALQYDAPAPRNDLAARFSFATVAALALIDSEVRFDSFSPQRFLRADVQSLASRVRLTTDAELDALYPANRPSRVTLTFADGRRETEQVLLPKGDGMAALGDHDVRAKAERLLGYAWGPKRSADVAEHVWRVEYANAAFVPGLAALLRRPFGIQD